MDKKRGERLFAVVLLGLFWLAGFSVRAVTTFEITVPSLDSGATVPLNCNLVANVLDYVPPWDHHVNASVTAYLGGTLCYSNTLIDVNNYQLSFQIPITKPGQVELVVNGTDSDGGTDSKRWTLNVLDTPMLETINLVPGQKLVLGENVDLVINRSHAYRTNLGVSVKLLKPVPEFGYTNWYEIGYSTGSPCRVQWCPSLVGEAIVRAEVSLFPGSILSVPVTILPRGLPVISKQPQSSSAAIGGTSTFSAEVLSVNPVSFQWFLNGSALPGGTNSTFAVSPVQSGDEGIYSVLVANNVGAVMSEGVSLRISNPATDPKGYVYLGVGSFSPYTYFEGSVYVQLYAGSSMDQLAPVNNPIKILSGTNYSGGTVSSELLPIGKSCYFQLRGWKGTTTSMNDAWVYGSSEIISAVPVGAAGTPRPLLRFANMELYLWDKYQLYTGVSTNGSTKLGGTFQFVAWGRTLTGFSDPPFVQTDTGWPMYFQWRKDGVNIPGATNNTLNITNFQGTSAGDYSCLFYNGRGAYTLGYNLAADFTPHLKPAGTADSRGVWMFANPGTPVTFQVSSNLAVWTDLATVVPATNQLQFSFPAEAVSKTNVFYRAVLKP